jgi:hypothetical protein
MNGKPRALTLASMTLLLLLGAAESLFAQNEFGIVQNALLEGVQLSSEAGSKPGEKVVSCYFIFRDKPSSFFSEVNHREKKIVFEFYDSKKSASPIPEAVESPISRLVVEEKRVDLNKDVKGLNPDWHDLLTATFYVDHIPDITVNEEYNIISFSYKWTSDPSALKEYIVKDKRKLVVPITLATSGVVAGAFLTAYLLKDDQPPGPEMLNANDLPFRPNPK